jgi:glycosyltransferase involved in cell wall biosynthesis
MAAITIGLPVYNEGELLRGSLETLARQTFTDFEVLIYDNASSDTTGEVAQSFAAQDPRFRYFRQSENKGALPNFYDCLLAAKSEYFLWRAADDRSDDNYLDVLHRLLEADASKSLAVGNVLSGDLDGGRQKLTLPPNAQVAAKWSTRITNLRSSHASWIYGLFRRAPLTERMNTVMNVYGYPWGFDHLVLFSFVIDNAVAGSPETTFQQVIKRSRATRTATDKKRSKPDPALMAELRRKFFAQVREDVRSRERNAVMRARLDAAMWLYTGKRVYKYRKLLSRKLFG